VQAAEVIAVAQVLAVAAQMLAVAVVTHVVETTRFMGLESMAVILEAHVGF